MPGSVRIAEPGLAAVTPGSGEIMIAPVSVCHQVSTIGQLSRADVLPVPHPGLGVDRLADADPSTRSDDRSNFSGISLPHFMNVRISVGAV